MSLIIFFAACSKEKQVLTTDSQKITTTTKTASLLKTETTATTYAKIVNVAFSSVVDGLNVSFTSNSVSLNKNYAISSYVWDFGDGKDTTTIDNKPFTHMYSAVGNRNVKLTVNMVDNIDNSPVEGGPFFTKKNISIIDIIPIAKFSISTSPDGLSATVTNTSNDAIEYEWNFGDRTPPEKNSDYEIVHRYKAEGDFPITLTATSKTGHKSTTIQTVSIKEKWTIDLSYKTSLEDLFVKNFMGQYTLSPLNVDSFSLDFGDRSEPLTGKDIELFYRDLFGRHEYKDGGDYTATFKVTSKTGRTDTLSKTISLPLDCIARFNFIPPSIFNIGFSFINHSHNATSFKWDFGDGNTSTSENVEKYFYKAPGTYTVTLTTSDGKGGSSSYQKTVVSP